MREAATYPLVIPIDTNRGRGETRRIGPTRVTFSTAAEFEAGDDLRFALSLHGTGTTPLDVFCSGSVRSVAAEGELFVVDAAISETRIALRE